LRITTGSRPGLWSLYLLIARQVGGGYHAGMSTFHDFEVKTIQGETTGLDKYRDQVSLIVNVASQ